MKRYESRLAKLEKKVGKQDMLTLEELVSAASGDPEAIRKVDAAEARGDDRLIMVLQETVERGKRVMAERDKHEAQYEDV